jgi:hypothetical protein
VSRKTNFVALQQKIQIIDVLKIFYFVFLQYRVLIDAVPLLLFLQVLSPLKHKRSTREYFLYGSNYEFELFLYADSSVE